MHVPDVPMGLNVSYSLKKEMLFRYFHITVIRIRYSEKNFITIHSKLGITITE